MIRRLWVRLPTRAILEKFPHARQVVAVRVISENRRPESKERRPEIHYYVVTGKAGMSRIKPGRLAKIIRNHWGIENRLHHVLDRTLREDAQRTHVGQGAQILSLLRKCALALLQTARPRRARKAYLPEIQAGLLARPKGALRLIKAEAT